jgi:hypothetical protein
MFIHAVLFQIASQELAKYHRDCRMWARYAQTAKGFKRYLTIKRIDYKNQYASVYSWQAKKYHDAFMKKYHDWLVAESKAKVKILGYYNMKSLLLFS